MPDNPHPHPSEFTGSTQLFLVALIHLIKQHAVNLGPQATTAQAPGARYSTTFFSRSPGD